MRIVMFVHSVRSCWNHGSAHFLRGVATELLARGHSLTLYEPRDGWSAANLAADHGAEALEGYRASYPALDSTFYDAGVDLDLALDGADLVLVHEWTAPELVARIGRKRRTRGFRLLFHDTHPESMGQVTLDDYDGVLAFSDALRDLYLRRGGCQRAWTWHEAADVRVFHPRPAAGPEADLVWMGSWGEALCEYVFDPARALGLSGVIFGARYPAHARAAVDGAGLQYAGWLPSHEIPRVLPRFRLTVYVHPAPGIRVFEALACGVPLVCAPSSGVEHLFEPGVHYLPAASGTQVARHVRLLINDRAAGRELAARGRARILERHTCAHRVDELLGIVRALDSAGRSRLTG